MKIFKNSSTLLLKNIIVIIGLLAAGFAFIVIPDEVSLEDIKHFWPFFVGIYIVLFTFFFALFQTFKLLTYVDQNKAFSDSTVKSLKMIQYCAIVIGIIFGTFLPFMFNIAQSEDAPGVAAIGMILVLGSIVVATGAAVLGKLIQNAIDIKSENDLTV